MGLPPITRVSRTLPSGATVASSRTVPVMCIWRATSGYNGLTEVFTFRPTWSLTSPLGASCARVLTGTSVTAAVEKAIVANRNQTRRRRDIRHLKEVSSTSCCARTLQDGPCLDVCPGKRLKAAQQATIRELTALLKAGKHCIPSLYKVSPASQ